VLVLKTTSKHPEMISDCGTKDNGHLQIAAHRRLIGRRSWSFDRPMGIGDAMRVPNCAFARPVENRDV